MQGQVDAFSSIGRQLRHIKYRLDDGGLAGPTSNGARETCCCAFSCGGLKASRVLPRGIVIYRSACKTAAVPNDKKACRRSRARREAQGSFPGAKMIWREMARVHVACRQLQRVRVRVQDVGGVLTRADAACLQVVYRPFVHKDALV